MLQYQTVWTFYTSPRLEILHRLSYNDVYGILFRYLRWTIGCHMFVLALMWPLKLMMKFITIIKSSFPWQPNRRVGQAKCGWFVEELIQSNQGKHLRENFKSQVWSQFLPRTFFPWRTHLDHMGPTVWVKTWWGFYIRIIPQGVQFIWMVSGLM